jgi:hypothetical protein
MRGEVERASGAEWWWRAAGTCELGVGDGGEAEAADVGVVQTLVLQAIQNCLHEVSSKAIISLTGVEGALRVDVKHPIVSVGMAVIIQ